MLTLREICGTLPFLTTGTCIHSSRRIKKDLPWFSGLAQYYVGIQVTAGLAVQSELCGKTSK